MWLYTHAHGTHQDGSILLAGSVLAHCQQIISDPHCFLRIVNPPPLVIEVVGVVFGDGWKFHSVSKI